MVSATLSSAAAPRVPRSIHLFFTLIVALVAAFARPAPANSPPDGTAVQQPREAESGRLFFRNDDQSHTPAPLLHTDVRIAVSGMVARSVVKQQFHNTGAGWVEGIYVFPLPQDSAVDRLRLTIGERVITGTIEERQQAQRIYQQARAQGQRAGLVEQERPNIFTTSVANIGPGEKVTVEIEYQESLRYNQGRFALRFPLVVGPRYIPGEAVRVAGTGWAPVTNEVPDAHRITPPVRHPGEGPINPVSIEVEIDAGLKLAAVESGTHPITTSVNGNRVTVALAEERVPADRDFVLNWRPEAAAAPTAGLFAEERDGRTHLLVMLMPPTAEASPTVPPREMIFIIDTSGSMEGTSIRQAKAALHLGLDRLKPHDTFNIIQFNSTASVLFGGPQPATRDALRTAHDYVESLRATGGTEMLPALNLALDGRERPAGRVRQVVFMTDGAVGNEDALFKRIQERLGDSRLFTVGIGSAPNSWFMSRAAQAGRGSFTHIDKLGEVTQRMAALFEKLEKPVMTDVAVQWPAGGDVETYPAPIPDLYAGEPVVFVGRANGALPQDAAIRIRGRSAGQAWTRELSLAGRVDRPGVAPVWARRKLAALEDSRLEGTPPTQVREDSLKLALAYQLISRYTSLVAVDPMPARPQTAPLDRSEMPTNLPDGWSHEAVFGGQHASAPGAAKHAMAQRYAAPAAAPAPMVDQGMGNAVTLPQTATPAELKMIFGLLSMLAAVVLLVWQFRRGRRA
jgi:Ca-activated chloride channel family protein